METTIWLQNKAKYEKIKFSDFGPKNVTKQSYLSKKYAP